MLTNLEKKVATCVLLLYYIAAGAATPDSDADSIRIRTIEDVIVKANKARTTLASATPMQQISGADLKKLNNLSVADAIRYFSGVQLKDYGGVGGIKTVNVRSMGSAHTAVFYDGVAIGNAQNGQVDLSRYSLDNIEAIELFSANKSSIFQPARGFFSSNTLFLKSRAPRFEYDKSYNLRASIKGGSFGLINPSVLYEQRLSSVFSLSANIEAVVAHGKYKYRYAKAGGYDTTAIRQNGDVRSERAEIALTGKFHSGGELSVRGYFFDSERGLPGAIVANVYSHYQRQWDRTLSLHASYEQKFGEKYQLLANIKFSGDKSRYLDPEYITTDGPLDNRYRQNEFYASVVNMFTLRSWWSVSLATDLSINTLSANLYRFPYPTRYSYMGALSSRMQWDRLDVQLSVLGSRIEDRVKYYQQGDRRTVFCPVASISVQPFESRNFRLRAFYKESFRMPSFNDLYYTFVGNSSLRPEYTKQIDVGLSWLLDRPQGTLRSVSIQADGYYNKVKDKIVAMPAANLFRWTMMNLGLVEIGGVEFGSNVKLSLPAKLFLNLGLNYTFQRAVDITPSSTTFGEQIPYTPLHSGSLTANLEWREWQLNYSFIYTGDRYSQKANIPSNYIEPWYTSDLALRWNGQLWKKEFRFGVEVNNIFNQYYDVIKNFPMPGLSYRLSISVNI